MGTIAVLAGEGREVGEQGRAGDALEVAHHVAAALTGGEQPLGGEADEGAAHGDAVDPELLGERPLGRQPRARGDGTGEDSPAQLIGRRTE
jgi:hypothetical protein